METTDTGASFVAGILIMYVQKWFKRFDWYARFVQALPSADRNVHRLIAGLFSLIAALGIHYTMSGDSSAGWAIQISIPSASTLLKAGLDFVQVYTVQQFAYDTTRKPMGMPHDTSSQQQLAGGGSVIAVPPPVVVPTSTIKEEKP